MSGKILITVSVFLVVALGGVQAQSARTSYEPLTSPDFVKILTYFIDLDVFLNEEVPYYTGQVEMLFILKAHTKSLEVHAVNFSNLTATLSGASLNKKYKLNYTANEENNIIILNFPEIHLKLNNIYSLNFSYVNFLRKDSVGFFHTNYIVNHHPVRYAATHLQPAFARFMFPCFDEPALKATFILTVTHANEYEALSNEDAYTTTLNELNNRTTTSFHPSPMMSTYNLALILSNFNNKTEINNNVVHRVFYNNGSGHDIEAHLKTSILTLNKLNNYFNYNYSLNKLDHFPVDRQPNAIGQAVENWGLIMYNPNTMIHNNTLSVDQYIKEIHEIIHQYIGNVVTLKKWSELWINEGFTTYYSYIIGEQLFPKWNISRLFLNDINKFAVSNYGDTAIMSGMPEDEKYQKRKNNVNDFFHIGVYFKAAGIIKMIDDAIGNNVMLNAIRTLIKKYEFSSINTKIIANELQNQIIKLKTLGSVFSNIDMADMLHAWLINQGLPQINVIRNYYNNSITFIVNTKYTNKPNYNANQVWFVPLTFVTGCDPNFELTNATIILQSSITNLKLSQLNLDLANNEWLIVNKQQSGMFTVIYDDQNTKLIVDTLLNNHTKIHPINRALLFRDFGLHFEDIGNIVNIINGFTYIEKESDVNVIAEACEMMMHIMIQFRGTRIHNELKIILRGFSENFFNLIFNRQIKNNIIVKYLHEIDSMKLLEYVQNEVYNDKALDDSNIYPFNYISDDFTCVLYAHLEMEMFELIMKWLVEADTLDDFIDLITNINCIRDEYLLKMFLEMFFDKNVVYYSDDTKDYNDIKTKLSYVIHLFKTNHIAQPVILDFLIAKSTDYLSNITVAIDTIDNLTSFIAEAHEKKVKFLKKILIKK